MNIDFCEFVGHKIWVLADQTIGEVVHKFAHHDFDFMAVREGDAVLGLCSKRDVGILLGSKYGFSLFAAKPIREHLRPTPIFISTETPVHEVFTAVFAREEETFYDDILLLGTSGEFLGLIFTQTLIKLQNRFHLDSIRLLEAQSELIRQKNEQIEADLCLSRELQLALLPLSYPTFPPRSPNLAGIIRFCHFYRPFGIVGGDFFHFKKLSDSSAALFIADVMGHGVRSAIVAAMLRTLLEDLPMEKFSDPAGLISHINRSMTKILLEAGNSGLFATALALHIDAETQFMRYASAAHPLPLHVQNRHRRVVTLEHSNPGTVLGVFDQAIFVNQESSYERGDSVLAFTDGIIEVEDAAGHEFDRGQLGQAVMCTLDRPVDDMIEAILTQARAFSATGEFTDDVCIVGVDLS